MCELMGICAAKKISADFSFREFAGRDQNNADGWGLAWYPDRSAAIIKEPVPWRASRHTDFLESYHALRSSIYIAHVRHKTVGGEPTHADTHPFSRELAGQNFTFAHNGTLEGLSALNTSGRYQPVGETDSELLFCLLLDRLAHRGGKLAGEQDFRWLHHALCDFNRHGKLNCLLSDGKYLFCYHDTAGHQGLVWQLASVEGDASKHFADHEIQIALDSGQGTDAILVATHKLAPGNWTHFLPGQLLVFKSGKLAYQSPHQQPPVAKPAATLKA